MNDDLLTIRLSAYARSSEADLTTVELGLLLTALNRSLNKLVLSAKELERYALEYSPRQQEPTFIQLKIVSTNKGSVLLQTAAQFLSGIGLDPDTAKNLLLNILANALWDPKRTQTLVYDFSRAVTRIARGALGKTFQLVVQLKDAAIRIRADVSEDGEVRVSVENIPPDDIQ